MRLLLSLLLLPLLLGAQVTKPGLTAVVPELIAGLETHPALVYARYGQREMELDLYHPKNIAAPLPAIVCIHGGGWFKGERSNMTLLAQALAAKGYVTATISYRLSGEAKFPAAIEDCKAAIRFLRANADRFGIRSDAIGVTGLSAGGHLAALLSTSGGVKELEGSGGHAQQSSRVQACMAMGAQSDLQSDRIRALSRQPQDPFYRPFLGGNAVNIPEVYALASPRHHLDQGDHPLAFMAGDGDHESTHAKETRRDLMALGIATSLTLIPQAPHAFLGGQRAFDVCVTACDDFFTLHLKQSGKPIVECDLPALFAEGANWQLIGGGYAGCEGAQWVGDTLHYAAHHDGFAFKWSEATGLVVWRKDSPEATSFRPDGAGGFYVVEQTTRQLTRWNAQGERVEVLADTLEGRKLNRPNDVIVKSDGTLWFTDPDWLFSQRPQEKKELPGQFVFRFDPKTKTLTKAAEGFDKPNGIAFSPDEKHLFISDSGTPNVFRFPVNADGTLGPREVFATFTEKGLDGLALSPQGQLWVCTKDGIRITALNGKALGLLKTPGKPTSIAFGPEGRLAVTTRDACYVTRLK
jgi:sugar lactone lactonase YvrE/acetyl esterase/lipase